MSSIDLNCTDCVLVDFHGNCQAVTGMEAVCVCNIASVLHVGCGDLFRLSACFCKCFTDCSFHRCTCEAGSGPSVKISTLCLKNDSRQFLNRGAADSDGLLFTDNLYIGDLVLVYSDSNSDIAAESRCSCGICARSIGCESRCRQSKQKNHCQN